MKQLIQINDEWRIVRLDPKNWQIQQFVTVEKKDGSKVKEWTTENNYYGSCRQAIDALPSKMLDEVANTSLASVKLAYADIKATIAKAFNPEQA